MRSLKPQSKPPLKIAVVPPYGWSALRMNEKKVIEKWGKKLKGTGFISSIEFIPESLRPKCSYEHYNNCYLKQSRLAGARLGADALLFLSDSTVTDRYANPISLLNITIVAMWVVPAHHRDSYSIYEASLFDIDNGYLYAVAEGYGEHKMVRPYANVDWYSGQEEARIAALDDLGQKLYDAAKEAMEYYSSDKQ